MPAISGNVGAVFNGGTVTQPTSLSPSSPTATALTITAPAGAAANATDELNIVDEHGAFILESDAIGNFLWFMPGSGAAFHALDANGVKRIDATGQILTAIRAPVGGSANVTTSSSTSGLAVSDAGHIGFFGSAGSAKPTVTGAKGGNAALASLMTALDSLGLVTDSTT